MNIIIPMSGLGKRFIEAGYKKPKFLMEIEGKPIIQHMSNFSLEGRALALAVNAAFLSELSVFKDIS